MDLPKGFGDRLRQNWISATAVAAVAAAAVATVMVSTRPLVDDRGRPQRPLEQEVVKAPPITVPNTAVAGGPPAAAECANCGVVEAVAMLDNHGAYQMRIRMSDGSVRTLEQAVPLVAGSRVVVEGGKARPAPLPPTQG